MRVTLLLLLFANVAFFAWTQYSAELRAVTSEQQLAGQQLNPEAIQLLTAQELAALAPSVGAVSGAAACLEWGAFNQADVARVSAVLAGLSLGDRLSQRRAGDTAAYWVFMPPQSTRQAALQKVGELKRLGVTEYFVIQDDPRTRFAILLGIFRTEEAAKNHLAQLREKGVRTAQVGRRDSAVQQVFFRVRDPSGAQSARLAELKLAFPGSELRDCAVPPDDDKARPAA